MNYALADLYICNAYGSDYMLKKVKGQEEEESLREVFKPNRR